MAIAKGKIELGQLWVTGYKPTQQDYADLFNSYLNVVDSPQPLTYKAILTQVDTNVPVEVNMNNLRAVAPMVNTLGGGWSYFDVGIYRYTHMATVFADADKVFVTVPMSGGGSIATDIVISWSIIDSNTLEFTTKEHGTNADNLLLVQPIIIEVYP